MLSLIGNTYDFVMQNAINEIARSYGHSVDIVAKSKSLLKFGNNPDLDTGVWETVWQTGGDETYVDTNIIDTISSSSTSDVGQVINIEGHTVTGTGADQQFTFIVQDATLNGQNKVTLATPLARVSRAYNSSTTDLVGIVHVYEDTALSGGDPIDDTKEHISIRGTLGDQQSFKAATTFSDSDYFICTGGWASITRSSTAAVDFELQIRRPGQTFRPVSRMTLNSTGSTTNQIQFNPYVVIPRNCDIRVRAVSTANNVEVNASFQGYIAKVR